MTNDEFYADKFTPAEHQEYREYLTTLDELASGKWHEDEMPSPAEITEFERLEREWDMIPF